MEDSKKGFLKTNSKIVCREEEGDALLFNPEDGAIKILNQVGYEIWKLCDGSLTLQQIIEKLKDEYPNVPAEAIKADIVNFIKHMQNLTLIEEVAD